MNATKEMEMGLLSSMYHQMRRYEETRLIGIKEQDFQAPLHKSVWNAIQQAYDTGAKGVSTEHLIEAGVPAETVRAVVEGLQKGSQEENSFSYYLQKMAIHKQDRRRQKITERYLADIASTTDYKEKQALSTKMNQELMELDMMFVGDGEASMEEIVPDLYSDAMAHVKPIPTGYDWIDRYTEGLWRGLPHIIAAESGNGKSTIMRNLAIRMSLPEAYGGVGKRVLIISLEMTKELLTSQMLAILDDAEMRDWYSFNIPEEKLAQKRDQAMRLARIIPNLKIDDGSYTPEKLAQKIRSCSGKYDVVIVDYFQHLHIPDGQNEGQAYNRASKLITKATKEAKDVALVMLSQVTAKDGEKAKTEKQHREAKLRYAKQLLNDTVFELIVYRDQEESENGEDRPDFGNEKSMINLFIRKNRNGVQEIHTKLPYFPTKGIIGGGWNKIKPAQTTKELLMGWNGKGKPVFGVDNITVIEGLTRKELTYLGYRIDPVHFEEEDHNEPRIQVLKEYEHLVPEWKKEEAFHALLHPQTEEEASFEGDFGWDDFDELFEEVSGA